MTRKRMTMLKGIVLGIGGLMPMVALGDHLRDDIYDISRAIQAEIYDSDSSPGDLENARDLLRDALRIIRRGGGGNVTYRFRCEPVDARYSSLENYLKIIVRRASGTRSRVVDKLNFRSECREVADRLNSLGNSGPCRLKYCQADDPTYNSLDTTLYELVVQRDGSTSINAVDRFAYRRDCSRYEN